MNDILIFLVCLYMVLKLKKWEEQCKAKIEHLKKCSPPISFDKAANPGVLILFFFQISNFQANPFNSFNAKGLFITQGFLQFITGLCFVTVCFKVDKNAAKLNTTCGVKFNECLISILTNKPWGIKQWKRRERDMRGGGTYYFMSWNDLR